MTLRCIAALAAAAALALAGCGNCSTAGTVCGSDGYQYPGCGLPIGVTAVPDSCCILDDGGAAVGGPALNGARDLCSLPEECRVGQPGTCIPPGSTLLPDGGILLADGGSL